MLASFRRLSKSQGRHDHHGAVRARDRRQLRAGRHQQRRSGGVRRRAAARWSRSATRKSPSATQQRAWSAGWPRSRQQNPEATYAALAGDFDPLLVEQLIDEPRCRPSPRDNGLHRVEAAGRCRNRQASRRRAGSTASSARPAYRQLPPAAAADRRRGAPTARRRPCCSGCCSAPVAANARVPVGVATPYASMLLEAREARSRWSRPAAFRAGLDARPTPTSRRFYTQNRRATWCPSSACCASPRSAPSRSPTSPPTEQEIAAYYNANQATYGGKRRACSARRWCRPRPPPTRSSRARAAARASSPRPRRPASAPPTSRRAADPRAIHRRWPATEVAAAAFARRAGRGRRADPVRPRLARRQGRRGPRRSRARRWPGARRDRRPADRRQAQEALIDLVAKVEEAIADGPASPRRRAATGLTADRNPADHRRRRRPRATRLSSLPAELAPALKRRLRARPDDDPVVETLPGEAGYAAGRGRPRSSPPRRRRWPRSATGSPPTGQPSRRADRARAVATAIAAKVATRHADLPRPSPSAGVALPPVEPVRARAASQLAQMRRQGAAPALNLMFSLAQGKSRMVADPQGRGFFIVKRDQDHARQCRCCSPALIARTQGEFQQARGAGICRAVRSARSRPTSGSSATRRRSPRRASGSSAAATDAGSASAAPILAIDNYDSFTFTLVDYLRVARRRGDGSSATTRSTRRRGAGRAVRRDPRSRPGPGAPEDAGISVELAARLHRAAAAAARRLPRPPGDRAGLRRDGRRGSPPMHGKIAQVRHDGSGLFAGLPSPFAATRYHSLAVTELAPPLIANAWSEDGMVMAMRHARRAGRTASSSTPKASPPSMAMRLLARSCDCAASALDGARSFPTRSPFVPRHGSLADAHRQAA